MQIRLTVNGESHTVDTYSTRRLLDVLRDDLGLTGTKEGCGVGDCGGCTILLDGKPVNACLMLAPSAEGKAITTVEGLLCEGRPSRLQEAFVACDAVQCGFCTPGMIMSATALLEQNPTPSEREIRHALAGNLCRCTGYHRIIAAVQTAADREVTPK